MLAGSTWSLQRLIWSGGTAEPIQRVHRNPDDDGHCRFIERGSVVVAWDGEVDPCIALMHSYRCFVLDREKTSIVTRWGTLQRGHPEGLEQGRIQELSQAGA